MLICRSSENATMLFSPFYHQLLVNCQQTSNQWDKRSANIRVGKEMPTGGSRRISVKPGMFIKSFFFLLNKYLQLETRLCYVCEQWWWMDNLHHFTPTPGQWQTEWETQDSNVTPCVLNPYCFSFQVIINIWPSPTLEWTHSGPDTDVSFFTFFFFFFGCRYLVLYSYTNVFFSYRWLYHLGTKHAATYKEKHREWWRWQEQGLRCVWHILSSGKFFFWLSFFLYY